MTNLFESNRIADAARRADCFYSAHTTANEADIRGQPITLPLSRRPSAQSVEPAFTNQYARLIRIVALTHSRIASVLNAASHSPLAAESFVP
ncbi:hypothetical protein [Paraburkholderia antibiotica]|uniref:Uncharacterized protein n=1 Tax=Paraburkholderia antibiotica TaxID=2728839 RepID=A0A7X9X2D9_9BURK|nr:hypothetical protein [Paraburkholderia antibiotica]NML30091.1 hypothetical protein [Paraburkholderia antibiotica]